MTDFLLLEQINQLIHSTEKPRLLYKKGIMASGSFRPYMSLADYTQAEFLSSPDCETRAAVRFSKASGHSAGADSLRDTRGFAVRFFTEEGDYDLIGHNFPVFYIKKAEDFPEWIQSMLPGKDGFAEQSAYWSFFSRHPEAAGVTLRLFSDLGTLKSYRSMRGYSIGTYKWVNAQKHIFYVRYRWVPLRNGEEYHVDSTGISDQEAEFLAGFEPDYAGRDLYQALEEKLFPIYELQVQIIPEEDAAKWGNTLLDATVFWPEERVPYLRIGKLELTEKLIEENDDIFCFAPSNLVEGIQMGSEEFLQVMDYILKADGRRRGGVR